MKLTFEEVIAFNNQDLTNRFLKEDGIELLISAVRSNNLEKIGKLLDNGVNIDEIYNNTSPLIIAMHLDATDDCAIIKYLISRGADLEKIVDIYSPLFVACDGFSERKVKIVEILIEHGADLNKCCENISPLMKLLRIKRFCDVIPTMKLMLEHRADVNYRTIDGENILTYILNQQEEVIEPLISLILEHGFQVKSEDIVKIHDTKIKNMLSVQISEYVHFGIESNEKLEISYPSIVEINKDNKYYYVFKIIKKNKKSPIPNENQITIMKYLSSYFSRQELQMFYNL